MAVSGGCPHLSVSECTSMPLSVAPTLTDLPNELLVHIISYLDTRSVLYLHTACKRLRALSSDPVNWSSILWRANNRINDVHGLKLALRLSKGVLKHISVFCNGWHLSKCIDQILSCHHLRNISLRKMFQTEKQVVKLLRLPGLTYLHLDEVGIPLLKSIVTMGRQLKTLSFSLKHSSICHHADVWSKAGYIPPDLRIERRRQRCGSFEIKAILSLPPSVNHSAYLSVYHQEIIPSHPYLQFQFTPIPTLPVTQPMELIATADTPGSKEFSAASYNCYYKGMKRNIMLCDILCDTLTVLRLDSASGLTSDLLTELTGVLPNLVHLDLSRCDDVLSDLSGLAAVSTSCPKLKVLSLLGIERVESLEKLWKILATNVNLRVLTVQASLILEKSDPIPMPSLTAIKISGNQWGHNIEWILAFLAQMSTLEMLMFEHLPPVTVFHGFSMLLHASTNLTHLYISKRTGNKLTLPSDPSCYANLEHFYFDCEDFIFRDDLASAIAQSKKLRRLVLNISYFDVKGIIDIVKFSKSLSVFSVSVSSPQGLNCTGPWSNGRTKILVKSLRDIAKKAGRIIEFAMRVQHWDWYPEATRIRIPEVFIMS